MKILFAGLFLAMLNLASAWADEAAVVGHIQTMKGSVAIVRATSLIPGAPGFEIRQGDAVRTGKPGAVGLVFLDNSTVSLGSGSELLVSEYVFEPRDGKFSLVMRMVKGSFSYVSGLIGKLAPESIRLQLPEATIAVRGTKLLVEVAE